MDNNTADKFIREQLEKAAHMASFQSMKCGEYGSYKEDYYQELNKDINDLISSLEDELTEE